jgi:isopentenyl-diphosphate Delta-isomerase
LTLRLLLKSSTMENRKKDHIQLAFESKTETNDPRFYYEPLLSAHPGESLQAISFLGKSLSFPIWISSMTGGTRMAGRINQNLARAAGEFKLGMGLGSCRILLEDDTYLTDFQVRKYLGDDQPLYANLGIAQVEEIVLKKNYRQIRELLDKLEADGLIVHINPFQEFFQPEGDRINESPLKTLSELLEHVNYPIVVKEVGQGMGPESIRQLFELPISGFEYAAFGGTNFSKLEMLRTKEGTDFGLSSFMFTGHTAQEMTSFIRGIAQENPALHIPGLIISGGIKDFLDGYYHIQQSGFPAVYGQASSFLKHAMNSYEELQEFVRIQTEGLKLASAYLRVKKVNPQKDN